MAQLLAYLFQDPAALGSIPSVPKSMLLRLIYGTALRKVDSGLNILIEPI